MFLIYFLLVSVLLLTSVSLAVSSGNFSIRKNLLGTRISFILCFLILFSFIGFRYNVGRDFVNYWGDYKYIDASDFGETFSYYKYEYGYWAILQLGRFLNWGPQSLFIISSFVSLCFFFNLFREHKPLLPVALFVFLLGTSYVFIINGIRQGIAIFAFLNALSSLTEGNYASRTLRFLLWSIVGAFFHNSVLFFLPCLVLQFNGLIERFNSKILVLIAISGFLLNVSGLTSNLLPEMDFLGTEGYSYGTAFQSDKFDVEESVLSIGNVFRLFLFLIPLFCYDKIAKVYPQFRVFFVSVALGCAIFFLFSNNMFTQRVSYYFLFSELLVFPIMRSYYKKQRKVFNWWYICGAMIIVLYLYSLPSFFAGQVWPNATIWGIAIN